MKLSQSFLFALASLCLIFAGLVVILGESGSLSGYFFIAAGLINGILSYRAHGRSS